MLPLPALIIVALGLLGNGTIPDRDDGILQAQPVTIDGTVPQGHCNTAECKLSVEQKEIQEKAAIGKAAQEKVAQEKAAQEKAAHKKAAQEKVAQEKVAQEKAAQAKAAQEKVAQENAAHKKAAQEKVAQEKTAHKKAAQEKAAQEKVAQEKVAQEKAAQEKAAQEKAAREQATQGKPAQEKVTDDEGPGVPEPYEGGTKWTNEQLIALDKHNELRNLHGSPILGLSKGLCGMATKYAKYLASIDKMVHTTLEQRQNTGENLYVEFGRKVNTGEGARAVQHWYDEIKDYNYAKPGFSLKTGHFTQVVWHKTSEVGIGVAVSATGKTYVVANYWIGGNMEDEFAQNVGKRI